MIDQATITQGYDFTGKDPSAVLTSDELEHFEEGMRFKNEFRPADQIDFARAAQAVGAELDSLLL